MLILQGLFILFLSGKTDANAFAPFDLRRVNDDVVDALRKAWELAEYGRSAKEAGVVIVEEPNGRYSARVQSSNDLRFQVRLDILPGTVAVFHTHPNSSGYEPSVVDRKNADQLQIPTFTMTDRGLWGYNPKTRKISQVFPFRSWLEHRNWAY